MKPVKPRRTVDIAADSLRRSILAGEHPPGTRLPPERELAELLGVSRLTLRAAVSKLEAEGLLQPRQGRGIEVLDYSRTGGIGLLAYMDDGETVGQLLSLRRLFAAEAVALASERADAGDIARLKAMAARPIRSSTSSGWRWRSSSWVRAS